MTAEEAGDSVIEEVSRECGKYLSHTPIKMESLIVESKQQLTASEKRIAKRQYESEKNTNGGYACGRGRPRMEHRPIAHVRPFQSGNSPHGHSNMPPGMGSHHHSTAGIPSWRHAAMNLARQGTPPFNHQNSPSSLIGGLPFGSNPLLSPRHSSSPGCDGSSIQSMSRETVSFGPSIPNEEQNFLNDFPVRGSSSSQNGSSSNAVIPPPSDPLPFPSLLGNNFNQPRLDNVSSIMQFLKDGYSSSAALDLQRHRERTSLNLSSIIPQAPPGGTIDIIDSD
ncbi:Oidioi.mRNA.OKI2018_I69.chr1.g2007.t1.cds [Oikopleura dioica]|uniref:Oidioi.mRNA.OKI2018_I69.chr1.g2007.t1.cds n=1 Tax=Oikopleura dioica TaxID=34765 RepID=A0ABN7SV19_OIKDI|nr:Oidioi.mRNA.OKI2018_I69.chr1.g2007.t1.cds [Oikopleura dioica]